MLKVRGDAVILYDYYYYFNTMRCSLPSCSVRFYHGTDHTMSNRMEGYTSVASGNHQAVVFTFYRVKRVRWRMLFFFFLVLYVWVMFEDLSLSLLVRFSMTPTSYYLQSVRNNSRLFTLSLSIRPSSIYVIDETWNDIFVLCGYFLLYVCMHAIENITVW